MARVNEWKKTGPAILAACTVATWGAFGRLPAAEDGFFIPRYGAMDVASDPAVAETLLTAYPKDWICYIRRLRAT